MDWMCPVELIKWAVFSVQHSMLQYLTRIQMEKPHDEYFHAASMAIYCIKLHYQVHVPNIMRRNHPHRSHKADMNHHLLFVYMKKYAMSNRVETFVSSSSGAST